MLVPPPPPSYLDLVMLILEAALAVFDWVTIECNEEQDSKAMSQREIIMKGWSRVQTWELTVCEQNIHTGMAVFVTLL